MEKNNGGNEQLKKIVIFLGIIIVIFVAIGFLNQTQNNDDYYKNTISPNELEDKLKDGESTTVYFYSPECTYCNKATPVVVPLTKELNIDLQMYDVLENERGWDDYHLEGTPTIIHFEDGQEVARFDGYAKKEEYEQWFKEHVCK